MLSPLISLPSVYDLVEETDLLYMLRFGYNLGSVITEPFVYNMECGFCQLNTISQANQNSLIMECEPEFSSLSNGALGAAALSNYPLIGSAPRRVQSHLTFSKRKNILNLKLIRYTIEKIAKFRFRSNY